MNFTEWTTAYQPFTNPASGSKMFAPEGPERDRVLIHDFVYIWTLIATDRGLELVPGPNFNSPLGYFIGRNPWDGGKIPAAVSYTD